MRVGLQINAFAWPGGTEAIAPTLARIAAQADDVGFDSIWVMDHFFQIRGVGRVEDPMLEGWTTLGFLAAHTKRARLGLMVGGVHYRLPGLWVKAATTLAFGVAPHALGKDHPEGIVAGVHANYHFLYPPGNKWPLNAQFVKKFHERWKEYPNFEAEGAYTALHVLRTAIEKANQLTGGWPDDQAIITMLEVCAVR